MPSEKNYYQALEALDGIKEITKNDQIKQGEYIFDEVDEALAKKGAVCGGHKACLIGSLYVGYGIRYKVEGGYSSYVTLPGVDQEDRPEFMRRRPGLRLAYDALNACAEPKNPDGYYGSSYVSAAEQYFERTLQDADAATIRKEILALVNQAKRKLHRDARKEGFAL